MIETISERLKGFDSMADTMADQLMKKAGLADPLAAVLDESVDAFARAGHADATAGVSDDLISQLADDEIERMMSAEGRGVGPSGRGAMPHDASDIEVTGDAVAPASTESTDSGNVTASELDKLFQDLTANAPAPAAPVATAASPVPTPASVVEEAEQQVRHQLDKLVDEINLIPGLAEDTAAAKANPYPKQAERKTPPAPPVPEPTVVDEDTQRQLNALFDELSSAGATAPTEAPAKKVVAEALVEKQTAASVAHVAATPPAPVVAAPVAPAPAVVEKTSAAPQVEKAPVAEATTVNELDQLLCTEAAAKVEDAEHDAHAEAHAEAEVSHAEKSAIVDAAADAEKELEAAVAAVGAVTDHVPEASADHADDPVAAADSTPLPAAVPLYLKPLEWLNAPLERVPEHARELVGKIAILTLVNALAVLTYVLFFRH